MGKVRVGIIGVGNCASSLVQGIEYYKNAKETDFIPGLMHVNLGGYHISDIEFSCAIDIDKNKVGKDLAEAVFTKPNNTYKFSDVPRKNLKVLRGMTHDGLGKYLLVTSMKRGTLHARATKKATSRIDRRRMNLSESMAISGMRKMRMKVAAVVICKARFWSIPAMLLT